MSREKKRQYAARITNESRVVVREKLSAPTATRDRCAMEEVGISRTGAWIAEGRSETG